MRGRRIALSVMGAGLLAGTAFAFGSVAPAAASGGGGCGGPVTDTRGTEVIVKQFCFGPTILHVARGDTVTFRNHDPFAHDIIGANASWGSWSSLRFGHPMSYRFTSSGVYPYVCTYHPGMVGAIVVGDANRSSEASTTTTSKGPVVRVPNGRARVVSASIGGDTSSGSWPVAPIVAFALLALVDTALIAHLRRTRSS